MQRSQLTRELYNAARTNSTEADNPEAVKALRDYYCDELFSKHYTVLTDRQIKEVIDHLYELAGKTKKYTDGTISGRQRRKLWAEMILFALHYWDFDTQFVFNKVALTGNALRAKIRNIYDNKQTIPKQVIYRMCHECLNRKSNQFLIEGGYRREITEPERMNKFRYDKLNFGEADYLILRYQEVNKNLFHGSEGREMQLEFTRN